MSDVNTKILNALLKNESVEEVFRQELETAINQLLITELDAFLQYDRYDPAGHHQTAGKPFRVRRNGSGLVSRSGERDRISMVQR